VALRWPQDCALIQSTLDYRSVYRDLLHEKREQAGLAHVAPASSADLALAG
jgi:hypothetical protein